LLILLDKINLNFLIIKRTRLSSIIISNVYIYIAYLCLFLVMHMCERLWSAQLVRLQFIRLDWSIIVRIREKEDKCLYLQLYYNMVHSSSSSSSFYLIYATDRTLMMCYAHTSRKAYLVYLSIRTTVRVYIRWVLLFNIDNIFSLLHRNTT